MHLGTQRAKYPYALGAPDVKANNELKPYCLVGKGLPMAFQAGSLLGKGLNKKWSCSGYSSGAVAVDYNPDNWISQTKSKETPFPGNM